MLLIESACTMLPKKQHSPTTRGNIIRMVLKLSTIRTVKQQSN